MVYLDTERACLRCDAEANIAVNDPEVIVLISHNPRCEVLASHHHRGTDQHLHPVEGLPHLRVAHGQRAS